MKAPSRKSILTASATLLLVGMSFVLILTSRRDSNLPVYNGKTVEEWFYGEDGHPGRTTSVNDAILAYTKMGTNCVPYLMGKLQTQDTVLNTFYCKLHSRLPFSIQNNLPPALDASYVQMIAASHLDNLPARILDPFANEFLRVYPTLRKKPMSYTSIEHSLLTKIAVRLDQNEAKTRVFLELLRNPDSFIQLDAAITLSKIDAGITNGVPILLNAVTNRNEMDSKIAVIAAPTPTMLRRMVSQKQRQAHNALSVVAPELAKQYPIEEPEP